MKKLLLFLSAAALTCLSCQKDDICPPGTETTPRLVINFVDAEDPSRQKAVQGLLVQAVGEDEVLLGPVNTNSIEIPLRTDQNNTQYRFVSQSGSEEENEDLINFGYTPSPQYLNRACGFKVDFLNLGVATAEDTHNWIVSEIILQENVENETEAHISIAH